MPLDSLSARLRQKYQQKYVLSHKKFSAQNKANRAQLKMIHRCGTMSFARKWEEEAQMEQLTRPTNGKEGMNREEAFTDVMEEDGHGRAKMYEVGVTPKMLRNEDCQHHEQMNEVVQRMADEAHAKVRELEESHECTKQELIAAHEQTKQELITSNDATAQELAATKKKLAATEANLETTNQKVESMSIDLEAIRALMTSIQPLMGSATQPSGV